MQPLVTSLSEPVTLWGTVKRWDRNPIPFASVALLAKPSFGKGQGLKQVIRCDERGHFRFVLSGPLDLEAYLLAYLPGVGIGWTVVPLDTSRECTFQLFPAAALWGRLDGVRKVALTIRQLRPLAAFPPVPPLRLESTSLDFFHTSTDERGAFLFPFLPDLCEAVIEVRALPFQFSALVGREVSVVIPPAGKLVGAVVGEDGKPKGKVPVQLVPVQVQVPEGGQILPLTLTTDEAGCFQALLPSGEWMVWLPGSGEAEWVSAPQCIFVPPQQNGAPFPHSATPWHRARVGCRWQNTLPFTSPLCARPMARSLLQTLFPRRYGSCTTVARRGLRGAPSQGLLATVRSGRRMAK